MPAPIKVLVAMQNGDQEALLAMRRKSQRTKAAKKARRQKEAERILAETEAAEDWYQQQRLKRRLAEHEKEPWVVRRDDLLDPDQL